MPHPAPPARLRRGLTPVLLLLPCCVLSGVSPAAAQGPPESVQRLLGNVVRVEAGGRSGFGFVVGLLDRELLLATAYHTVDAPDVSKIEICFPDGGRPCASGRIVHIADARGSQPALDLVILALDYPDRLSWRPDAAATGRPGDPVWSIGRYGDWYIPERPGMIVGVDSAARTLSYENLELAQGVSGAPIVSPHGIVALHFESEGERGEAGGIQLSAIRERVEGPVRGAWILRSPATCEAESRYAAQLRGRSVEVHFDARQPDPGLEAITLLHCLGVDVLPVPVWADEPWPGSRIVYGSGALRLGRTLQSLLARYGRLEAEMGTPAAHVDIWIR